MHSRLPFPSIHRRPAGVRFVTSAAAWRAALALAILAGIERGAPAEVPDTEQGAAAGAADGRPASDADSVSKVEIETLIRELGSPRFSARRAAANELRRIGADAFDLLHSATDDPDPEVAASAHYLLRQITVRWVESDDSPMVRRLLRSYAAEPDQLRLRHIQELADLPDREGVAGLCRIARFDRSPLLARVAALAVIRPDMPDARRSPIDPEMIERELGASTRPTAVWLRQFQTQLRDPAAAAAPWKRLIDEEAARLERKSNETKPEILVGLMWNLADIYRQLGDRAGLGQVVDQMLSQESDDPERLSVALLLWLVDEKAWDTVDDLLTNHADRFTRGKRPLYMAALARQKQGKTPLAEELAEQASRLDPPGTIDGYRMAKEMELRDQFAWSVREYRRAIDGQPVEAPASLLSRVSLANMLHDHEDYKTAVEVLEPLAKGLQPGSAVMQAYDRLQRQRDLRLDERQVVLARFHYYRACQFHADEDWQRQRESLETALRFDRTDADVLIAMYRVPEADDQWRTTTRRKIADLCRDFQQKIEAAPDDPNAYNQWAWLVSNTEGDFQQAIRYSHKSLELLPPGAESASASLLDTLGRCYYAAGDFENAVKHQRQAVEKAPYMKTMQRQLELFEKALAEQQRAGNGAPATETQDVK